MEHHSKLKENKRAKKDGKRGWELELTNQINLTRRKISQIQVIQRCQEQKQYTKKQKTLTRWVRKLCGNLEPSTLTSKLAVLTHNLKVKNTKLKDMRTKAERSRINFQFVNNQKQIYRTWKIKQIEITNPPSTENICSFWAGIWQKDVQVNLDTEWYRNLIETYCTNATTKQYKINKEVFDWVLKRLPNNKAPGRDMLVGFWMKNIKAIHLNLINLYDQVMRGELDIPQWMITSKTILLPKNTETDKAKNYRPIACLNTMYKLYTGILNQFLEDHCESNSIITVEQAGGKKGSWGCTDQLLINKMILDEVRKHRRSIFTM